MKIKIYILTFIIAVLTTAGLYAHIDNYLLPEECGSCHAGHGLKGEPMLNHSEEDMCYECHGSENNRTMMKTSGKLSQQADLANIEKEFSKLYRHPVKTGTGHSPTERLPGLSASSINHAECVDCHNPHQRISSSASVKKYDVGGLSLSGQYLDKSVDEYEVCLKCHGSNIAIKSTSKNFSQVYSTRNQSQHPVTTNITSDKSTSLKLSLDFDQSMKCSDCHSNDDKDGPKGPHGSKYKYLLNGNYNTDIYGIESNYAYEFCYACHDRSSILSNKSFPLHKEHIVGDPLKQIKGTSCFTCHASHSSQKNNNLIEFNTLAVKKDPITNLIEYNSTGLNNGSCNLSCHNHAHSPARY